MNQPMVRRLVSSVGAATLSHDEVLNICGGSMLLTAIVILRMVWTSFITPAGPTLIAN